MRQRFYRIKQRIPRGTDSTILRFVSFLIIGYTIIQLVYALLIRWIVGLPDKEAIRTLVTLVETGGPSAWLGVTLGLCLITTKYYIKIDSWARSKSNREFNNLNRFSLWALVMLLIISTTTLRGLSINMGVYEAYSHGYYQTITYLGSIFSIPAARQAADLINVGSQEDLFASSTLALLFMTVYPVGIVASGLSVYLELSSIPKRAALPLFFAGLASYLSAAPIIIRETSQDGDLPMRIYDSIVTGIRNIDMEQTPRIAKSDYIVPLSALLIGSGLFVFEFSYYVENPPHNKSVGELIGMYVQTGFFTGIIGVLIGLSVLFLVPMIASKARSIQEWI